MNNIVYVIYMINSVSYIYIYYVVDIGNIIDNIYIMNSIFLLKFSYCYYLYKHTITTLKSPQY